MYLYFCDCEKHMAPNCRSLASLLESEGHVVDNQFDHRAGRPLRAWCLTWAYQDLLFSPPQESWHFTFIQATLCFVFFHTQNLTEFLLFCGRSCTSGQRVSFAGTLTWYYARMFCFHTAPVILTGTSTVYNWSFLSPVWFKRGQKKGGERKENRVSTLHDAPINIYWYYHHI